MTPRRPRDDEELPELPALEGDDEPLGDAAGTEALSDDEATLDDATADIALDHGLEELREGLGDDDGALDVGRDEDDVVVRDEGSALDDRGLDDRGAVDVDDLPPLAADADRGEEGPMEELLSLDAPPPLDDDDDDAPRPAPRVTYAAEPLAVDDVTDVAVDGARVWLLAGDVYTLDLAARGALRRIEAPDVLCGALGVVRRGAPALVTLEGAVLVLGDDEAWEVALPESRGALSLLRSGSGVWARGRGGALFGVDPPGLAAPRFRRVTACAADPAGGLAVIDGASRSTLHQRGDDGTWHETPLPQGFTTGRLAVRGDAVAALDAASGACWLRVEPSAAWTSIGVTGCVDVALLDADDGRTTLLLACADPRGTLLLLRADCDRRVDAPQRVATIRRAEEVEDATVSLRGVGREGVLCVALVDGVAYVVSASRS
ncbi:MAG: hypothetical protein U0325_33350 [Polyangiales bacterium]